MTAQPAKPESLSFEQHAYFISCYNFIIKDIIGN